MSSNLKKIISGIVILIVILVGYGFMAYNQDYDISDRVVHIDIKQGDNFNRIANILAEKKVIGSKLVIKIFARLNGVDKKLTPGRYPFTGKNSCKSVLSKLEKAEFLKIKVTIPEGMPIWGTAAILQEKMGFDSAQIVALNVKAAFLKSKKIPSLEGYLYPETYFFPYGASVEDVLSDMITMFYTVTDTIWQKDIPNNLSREEVIIMASIIEAETRLNSEHSRVSSVYHNRLNRNMRLDADPTVIYGLGGLDRPLWKKDLRKDSPYNTYMRKGLPPTPINSPGEKSIKAAISPEKTDFLYFVADNTGGHYFSKSNAEHNRAIKRIRSSDK